MNDFHKAFEKHLEPAYGALAHIEVQALTPAEQIAFAAAYAQLAAAQYTGQIAENVRQIVGVLQERGAWANLQKQAIGRIADVADPPKTVH